MRTPFFGPSYSAKYTNIAANRLLNLYPEIVEVEGAGKDIGAFRLAPGLDPYLTIGTGPIRGMFVLATILIIVSGASVYYVNSAGAVTGCGTMTTSTNGPVSIIGNVIGSTGQVVVFDGVAGWLVNFNNLVLSGFGQLNLPFSNAAPYGPPVSATYQDTFGLVNVNGSNLWYQSNPGDLSTWAPLNFSAADAFPDNVLAIISVHQEIWLLKQFDTEVWYDAGNSGFSFSRLSGTFIESGIIAPFSLVKGGQALFWLSNNPQGSGIALMATGYDPTRISTHPLEALWRTYPTMSDALGWCYQQEGHLFYVLTFPTANATWVYDATASAQLGQPCWHQRSAFENGQDNRHWGNCFASFAGLQLVGDYRNANVYAMNPATLTDNGSQRRWLRSWRALAKPSEQPVKFSSLRLDMLTGIGTPSGSEPQAPQVSLRWSDDGGYKWTPYIQRDAGQLGANAKRVKWNQLGSTRRNHGLDRVFEMSSTDPFAVSLIGAELE
jgi:hypothetical protein